MRGIGKFPYYINEKSADLLSDASKEKNFPCAAFQRIRNKQRHLQPLPSGRSISKNFFSCFQKKMPGPWQLSALKRFKFAIISVRPMVKSEVTSELLENQTWLGGG